MSRTSLTVSVLTIALLSPFAANAADLPRPAPGPVTAVGKMPELFNWTGFYAGIHVGYAWGKKGWTNPSDGERIADYDVDGLVAGGQVGLNYQTGGFLMGVEADLSWADADGKQHGISNQPDLILTTDVDWLATATARFGLVFGRTLIFVKGGAAWAREEYVSELPGSFRDAHEVRRSGWTIGAGFEAAAWENWTAKLEYNYMDFGSKRVVFTGNDPFDLEQKMHVVKAGLNYRFATGKTPGPLITKY